MRRTCRSAWRVLTHAGLVALAALASAAADDSVPSPGASLTLRPLAEAGTYAPGRVFTLAIDLAVPNGWHTYWINPGETGMAPDFKWRLPPGVALAALHFPVPRRFDDGVSISIGYEKDTRLLADFTTGPEVAGALEIGLEAVWMICRESCQPVTSQTTLALWPEKSPAAPPVPEAAQAVARQRLPRPGTGWTVAASRADARLTVRITPPPTVKLPAAAWRKAWLFPLQGNAIDLAAPPVWTPVDGSWIAQVKAGLTAPSAGAPLAFVLAFPTLPHTGWLLRSVVGQPEDFQP